MIAVIFELWPKRATGRYFELAAELRPIEADRRLHLGRTLRV
ncbi:MAG: hypothetical protein R3C69_10605 [Geminicoccaceae bacterium]